MSEKLLPDSEFITRDDDREVWIWYKDRKEHAARN